MVMLTGCGSSSSDLVSTRSVSTPPRVADAAGGSAGDLLTPVVASVTNSPHPVLATDGKVHLAYELLLTNVISSDTTITSVVARGHGKNFQVLAGDDLKGVFKIFGNPAGNTVLGAGQEAIVWMDTVVDSYAAVPKQLKHVVEIAVAKPQLPLIPATLTETVARMRIENVKPVVIGSPLRGKSWLDGNSCCAVTPHRAAVNPINGELWVPERFAIDYVQLDAQGRMFTGDVTDIKSYAYFGSHIHAVADGKIVAMVSDQPEQKPGANPVGLLLDQYGGNYVIQDIGHGHFAFYAHLQPDNPMKLEVGKRLERGEVLGLLGSTGNSDSPHLHFHIMDSPDPLASNGLPFAIDSFRYDGTVVSDESLNEGATTGVPFDIDTRGAGRRTKTSPLYRDVMSYSR